MLPAAVPDVTLHYTRHLPGNRCSRPGAPLRYSLFPLAALLATACGDDGGNTPPPNTPYTIALTGAGQGDTIGAFVSAPLVVRVEQGGDPAAGADVRIRVVDCSTECLQVAPIGGAFGSSITIPSNSGGEVRAQVHFGTRTGPAFIVAEVVGGTVADTGSYQVLPGGADSLVVTSPDTALLIGGRYQIAATVIDRGGNPTAVSVAVATDDPLVIRRNGDTFDALDYGNAEVTFSAPVRDAADTVWRRVTVVPPGRLLLVGDYGLTTGLYVANTDGSQRRLLSAAGYDGGSWSFDGLRAAYQGVAGLTLLQQDMQGHQQVLAGPEGRVNTVGFPTWAPDNSWIYFSAFPHGVPDAYFEIWRVHLNGSGLERVSEPTTSFGHGDAAPSMSPDGRRLAWQTTRAPDQVSRIAIHDLVTGVTAEVPGAVGYLPSWSPDGTRIAYVTWTGVYRLAIIPVEGGVPLEYPMDLWPARLGWSPDGNWIAFANSSGSTVLLELATSRLIDLPWASRLRATSWASGLLP